MTVNYCNVSIFTLAARVKQGSIMTLNYCNVAMHHKRCLDKDGTRRSTAVQYGHWGPGSLYTLDDVSEKRVNYINVHNDARLERSPTQIGSSGISQNTAPGGRKHKSHSVKECRKRQKTTIVA